MLEILLNVAIAIILGIVFQSLVIVIVYSLFFIPLRSFAGGWHASKAWLCTILSSILLLFVILLVKYEIIVLSPVLMTVLQLFCAGIVCCLAPMDTKAKRLSDNEKKHYKKVVSVLSIIDTICLTAFLIAGITEIADIIFLADVCVMCLLIFKKLSDNKDMIHRPK